MKILHILNDGSTTLSSEIISIQTKDHEVKVVDLAKVTARSAKLAGSAFSSTSPTMCSSKL